MNLRPLTSREAARWQRWLQASQSISLFHQDDLFRLEGDFTLYGRCLDKIEGLRIWLDRDSPEPLVQFDLSAGKPAVCRLMGMRTGMLQSKTQVGQLEQKLREAAKAGRIWWGAESLSDPPWYTTLLFCSPKPLLAGLPSQRRKP